MNEGPGRRRAYGMALGCLLVGGAVFTGGCFPSGCRERATFVDAPETPELPKGATGCLIINQGWDSAEPDRPRILAITLPDLKQKVVRQAVDNESVWAVGGPDAKGRLAFVTFNLGGETRHALKTMFLDGSREDLVFDRAGDPLWKNAIGQHVALSHEGNQAAFVSNGQGRQLPGVYLTVGSLEVWDVSNKTGRTTGVAAVDDELSWSPDGKQLAYVGIIEGSTPAEGIFIFDTTSGASRLFHRGRSPAFSPDWKEALVQEENHALLVDIETGQSTPFFQPSWNYPRFLLPNHLAIFGARPGKGTKPRWLKAGSFKAGSLMDAIKLGNMKSGAFRTIVPYADFRDEMSFGIPTATENQK